MSGALSVLEGRTPWVNECADALQWMDALPDACASLILTDPPYYRVKDEPWDRQWDQPEAFLGWIGQLCERWKRVLKPNGSLYVFASPEMAGRVECKVRESFGVLNHLCWQKENAGWHKKADKDGLRSFFPVTERLIFAEQYGADHDADGQSGYGLKCHFLHKDVFAPLGGYFQSERERAGFTRNEVEVGLGFVSSADPTRGTALCCRWEEGSSLPTAATYERLRDFLGSRGGSFLSRDLGDLKREREDLNQRYEDLRREYEDLRRPFNVSADVPYTDVWDFPTVPTRYGKHPCEKPSSLLKHIVEASSRPGDVVLDCFSGSGSTGKVAVATGRRFIGCDSSKKWVEYANSRIGCVQLTLLGEAA